MVEIFDSFMMRSTLAGVGVSICAAPLGCFIIWRRMAFFGDATAHSAILGVALALGFSISIFTGVLISSFLMALAVLALSNRGQSMDSLLGVMSHGALALGLVAASFFSQVRLDLMAYLFGDILAVNKSDLLIITLTALAVNVLMMWRWSSLLISTISVDLACSSKINVKKEEIALTVALALVVAVSIKIVGALLIVAILIIPPATARKFSTTPEAMLGATFVIGGASAIGGLQTALFLDTPAGPTIVCFAAALFVIANLIRAIV